MDTSTSGGGAELPAASRPVVSTDLPRPGMFERLVKRVFLRSAEVTAVEDVARQYRIIEIGGDMLKDLAWTPGQQIQIGVGPKLAHRTYTPMDLDGRTGRLRLLVYLHSEAPGCNFVRAGRVGQPCELMGPKRSLELAAEDEPPILFGDETCIGLAKAYRDADGGAAARVVLEVADLTQIRSILAGLNIGDALLIERRPDGSHLREAAQAVLAASAQRTRIVLAGRAPSIQAVKATLKAALIDQRRVKTKAYWAPGKVGLD